MGMYGSIASRFWGFGGSRNEHTTRASSSLPARPARWIAWAVANELPLPPGLKAEVEKFSRSDTETPQDKSGIAALESTVAALQLKLAAQESTKATVGTRERESMLKLIIGMAVRGYKYDASGKRSDSVPEIVSDLAIVGFARRRDRPKIFA